MGNSNRSGPSMDGEKITIRNCPLCHKNHAHFLHIEHDIVVGFLTEANFAKVIPKKIDVALTCPNKNATFKVTIELYETSSSPIKKVTER